MTAFHTIAVPRERVREEVGNTDCRRTTLRSWRASLPNLIRRSKTLRLERKNMITPEACTMGELG